MVSGGGRESARNPAGDVSALRVRQCFSNGCHTVCDVISSCQWPDPTAHLCTAGRNAGVPATQITKNAGAGHSVASFSVQCGHLRFRHLSDKWPSLGESARGRMSPQKRPIHSSNLIPGRQLHKTVICGVYLAHSEVLCDVLFDRKLGFWNSKKWHWGDKC